MATVMKATEFVNKLEDLAKNYKTLYVMGCFGDLMTSANKKRYTTNHNYNMQPARVKMINAASADTFGFDCVCMIKGILWGWTGDKTKSYGGAKYNTNGVPDIGADSMITKCKDLSTDFNKIEIGEALWTQGHIGVYIGDGLAIECTPAWKNGVQITAVNTAKAGYPTRKWKKHGKLPYIDYAVSEPTKPSKPNTSVKVDSAQKFDRTIGGQYKVNASGSLHIRAGAGTAKASLGILTSGTVVQNYGYYSIAPNNSKWLYVVTDKGVTGFCSARYLTKLK